MQATCWANQNSKQICIRRQARENACEQVMVTADWSRKWRVFFLQSQNIRKQNQNKRDSLSTLDWKPLWYTPNSFVSTSSGIVIALLLWSVVIFVFMWMHCLPVSTSLFIYGIPEGLLENYQILPRHLCDSKSSNIHSSSSLQIILLHIRYLLSCALNNLLIFSFKINS